MTNAVLQNYLTTMSSALLREYAPKSVLKHLNIVSLLCEFIKDDERIFILSMLNQNIREHIMISFDLKSICFTLKQKTDKSVFIKL
jgi:hypothetical protein